MTVLPKNLSTLPKDERIDKLIAHYQNAYDIWSKHRVDQEMLKNWLFLIEALKALKEKN